MAANSSLSGSSGSWGLEPSEGTTEANKLAGLTDHGVQEILLNGAGLGDPGKEQVSSAPGKAPPPRGWGGISMDAQSPLRAQEVGISISGLNLGTELMSSAQPQ